MSVSAGGLNQLTQEEKDAGFRLIFDGTSMDAWRNYKSETTRPQWKVEGGELVLTGKGGRDLVTREKFRHFDLRLEYTIAEGGNSGIMFRVVEDPEEKLPWRLAPEFQLFDSYNVKVRGERTAGALYGLVAAPQNLARKPGVWNQVRILLEPAGNNADRLRCWLNDRPTIDLVVDHSPDSEWSKLINRHNLEKNGTKYELPPAFFKAKTGHVLLQDHGARVAFRSIRIREPDATPPHTLCEEEVAEGFELIFDGEKFDGWKQRDGNWIVEDGTICRAKRGGSLIYEEKPLPDDFEFRLGWKVAPGTNSGVKYRNADFEYQILDNSSKPVELLNPRQAAASIYFGVAPCCDMTKESGQWNTGRIVCKGTVIQHWLNGKKVADLDCIADGLFYSKMHEFTDGRALADGWVGWPGWGGNIIVREFVQHDNGNLGLKFVPEMIPASGKPLSLQVTQKEGDVSGDFKKLRIRAGKSLGYAAVDDVPHNIRIRLRVHPSKEVEAFGLCLRGEGDYSEGNEISFRPAEKHVQFGHPHEGGPGRKEPVSTIINGDAGAAPPVEGLDKPFSIDIITRDRILDVCIDNRRTFIARRHGLGGKRLFFFAKGGEVVFEQIEIRPLLDQ